jgi:uncharacterized damage-inducible protein DinB
MRSEREDLLEHLERYRAITLQHIDLFADAELGWRPRPDAFSVGQQFVHILQSEEFYIRGLFENDWNMARLQFPPLLPAREALKEQFAAVRRATHRHLSGVSDDALGRVISPPDLGGMEAQIWPRDPSLRSWLWYVLEHEIHHKAQLAQYLRAVGRVPPYFAVVTPAGVRPDIEARAALGGV